MQAGWAQVRGWEREAWRAALGGSQSSWVWARPRLGGVGDALECQMPDASWGSWASHPILGRPWGAQARGRWSVGVGGGVGGCVLAGVGGWGWLGPWQAAWRSKVCVGRLVSFSGGRAWTWSRLEGADDRDRWAGVGRTDSIYTVGATLANPGRADEKCATDSVQSGAHPTPLTHDGRWGYCKGCIYRRDVYTLRDPSPPIDGRMSTWIPSTHES